MNGLVKLKGNDIFTDSLDTTNLFMVSCFCLINCIIIVMLLVNFFCASHNVGRRKLG